MTTPKFATPVDPEATSHTLCRICWTPLRRRFDESEWVHGDTGLNFCAAGVSPNRVFRIPDPEYDAAKAVADRRGETLTGIVRRAFQDYILRDLDR